MCCCCTMPGMAAGGGGQAGGGPQEEEGPHSPGPGTICFELLLPGHHAHVCQEAWYSLCTYILCHCGHKLLCTFMASRRPLVRTPQLRLILLPTPLRPCIVCLHFNTVLM